MPINPSRTRLGLILAMTAVFVVFASLYYSAAQGAEPVMTYVGARNLNDFSQGK